MSHCTSRRWAAVVAAVGIALPVLSGPAAATSASPARIGVNDATTMRSLIDAGVDGLITDRPDALRASCPSTKSSSRSVTRATTPRSLTSPLSPLLIKKVSDRKVVPAPLLPLAQAKVDGHALGAPRAVGLADTKSRHSWTSNCSASRDPLRHREDKTRAAKYRRDPAHAFTSTMPTLRQCSLAAQPCGERPLEQDPFR